MAQQFDEVVVDISKLRDYCLSDAHPRGRHKARVFRSILGLAQSDAAELRVTLQDHARRRAEDLRPVASDSFGDRYSLDFEMTTKQGTASIRSTWIVRPGEKVLRFVTCYVMVK